VKGRGKEIEEKICVERFLNWYNEQHRRNYICERADTYFPDLKNELNWDFVAYERDNPKLWLGIEVKELPHLMEISLWFEFWRCLSLELTKDLESKGIKGQFEIGVPPVLDSTGKRQRFLEAFGRVLIDKRSGWQVCESKDVGPDIASKFPNWPTQKSEPFDEYDKWGTYRPCKLEITKVSNSGCEVTSPISPIRVFDVPEKHEAAFNAVFKPKNDVTRANKQLKLAKEKGARNTMLLLCCDPSVEESLIQHEVHKLDRHLISDIDYIYLVDVGSNDRVAKMYPS